MSHPHDLPIPAEQLAPQRPPMLLVGSLVEYGQGSAVVEACIPPDSLMVDEDGYVESTAIIEIIAQGHAVVSGYESLLDEEPVAKGFLVGLSKLNLTKKVRAGKTLRVATKAPTYVGDFAIAESEVFCEGQRVAFGTVKFWTLNEQDTPQ